MVRTTSVSPSGISGTSAVKDSSRPPGGRTAFRTGSGSGRDLAGEHLVEGAAQRVDIAPGVHRVRVPRLLGRDVVEGADGRPVPGHRHLLGQVDRQPEVGQLGRAVGGDHDVVRVDVAVDQPFLMGVLQTQGDLPGQPGGGAGAERAVLGEHARRWFCPR